MPNLVGFADFLAATRDVKVTSKSTLLTEATKNTYFLAEMLKGTDVAKSFKGGTKLVEKVQSADAGNFTFYSPNDVFTPNQTDTIKTVEVPWAFGQTHYVFTEETTTLNAGDPNAYIDLKRSYEQGCVVDIVNGMEEALWALPNVDTMESAAADPKVPYSFLAFITRDGLVPAAGNGGLATGSGAWTTIETINPTTETWFRNKSGTYTAATPDDPDAGLVAALDDIVLQAKFDMPSALRKYSETESLRKQKIVTSRDGVVFYKSRLRMLNDRMAMLQDPAINGPQYQGIPVMYVSELDGLGWTANQPDFIGLNLNYMGPFFHDQWYMKEKMKDGGAAQPNTTVVYKFIWYNLFMRSRRRQWRLYAA